MSGFTETLRLLLEMAGERDRAMFDIAARLSSVRDTLTALIAECDAADMSAGSLHEVLGEIIAIEGLAEEERAHAAEGVKDLEAELARRGGGA